MEIAGLFKRFWAIMLLPPTLLGVWFFPSDWSTSANPEVVAPWRRVAGMVDQNVLLWTLCAGLSAWVMWSEVRPFILGRFRQKMRPLSVHQKVFCECESFDSGKAFRVRAYLIVENALRSRATLRNVGATVRSISAPIPLTLRRSKETKTDIRHGEAAFFELGKFMTSEFIGSPSTVLHHLDEQEQFEIGHNLQNGHRSFKLGDGASGGIGFMKGVPVYGFPVYSIVSADDVASTAVRITLSLLELPDVEKAFKLEIVEP